MKRDEKLLRLAYRHSLQSKHKFPMVGLLAQGKRVISIGVNSDKTHPKQTPRKNSNGTSYGRHQIHAERDCLLRAPYEQIDGSTLYVLRRLSTGITGLAKPCYVCEKLIFDTNIRRVVYTTRPTEPGEKIGYKIWDVR